MLIKDWRKLAFVLNMAGCAQFILFTFIGMLFYAGGTYDNPTTPGYSFFMNFFSDIGRTVAHSGQPNLIAFLFFSIAFFLVGLLLIPSFLAYPSFFKTNKILKWICILGSAIGLFTSFCFTGITFAPSDINVAAHIWFVYGGFVSGFFVSMLYTFTIFFSKSYPKRYGINFLVFTIILALYIILMFTGPEGSTTEGLIIQVTGQKIVLYSFAICLFIHGYGAWKQIKS